MLRTLKLRTPIVTAALAAATLLALMAAQPAHAQNYTIKNIGWFAGSVRDYSVANGINASGQVAAQSGDEALCWLGAGFVGVPGLPGAVDGTAQAIGRPVVLAGNSAFGNETVEAFVYHYYAGLTVPVGDLGGGFSQSWDINTNSEAVGGSSLPSGNEHAFAWVFGLLTDLGTVPGYDNAIATGVNAEGDVAGFAFQHNAPDQAFVITAGQMTAFPSPPGGGGSHAYGINDSLQVVGEVLTSSGNWHAALFAGNTVSDLGTLPGDTDSTAVAINNSGAIVGNSRCTDGGFTEQVPFLFQSGKMVDLNTLTPAGSGWTLVTATGIDNNGDICGSGYMADGNLRGYILKPAP